MENVATASNASVPVQLVDLPESFLLQLSKRLQQDDIKSLRLTCTKLCSLCNRSSRLSSLKASALLTEAPPTLARLPSITFLDFNARNAACSHQLLAALRQHGTRLESSVRSVRLSGRDGLLAALQTLRLACPRIESLEIRCQHSYRGRHKECADLGRCLQQLENGFPCLTELHLQRFPISSSQLVHLCDSLPRLRSLSIRGLTHALTSDSLVHLDRLSQLVSLSVDHLRLQGGCFPRCLQLRALELSDAAVSLRAFASLNALTGLQSLSLWGTGHRAALGFAPLTGLGALRRLHLELVLDAEVLAGLRGCTALASLSAQGARVLPPEGDDGGDAAGAGAEGAGGRGLLPQLTSVTRLSLEAWSEDCLPLAAWLPGLKSLVLQEGEGMWDAVAGHPGLTALRVVEGGSLPSATGAVERERVAGVGAVGVGPTTGGESSGVESGPGAEECCGGQQHGQYHHHFTHHHQHRHGRPGAGHHVGQASGSTDISSSGSSDGGGGGSKRGGVSGSCAASGTSSDGGSGAGGADGGGGGGVSCSDGSDAPGDVTQGHPAGLGGSNRDGCHSRHRSSSNKGAAGEGGRGADHDAPPGGGSCPGAPQLPPMLATLRLGGCQDLPERHYLSCAPLPALTAFDLAGCGGLTEEALAHLLGCMPQLQELALEGASHLTDQALAALGALRSSEGEGSCNAAAGPAARGAVQEGCELVDGGLGSAAPSAAMCAPALLAAAKAVATATGVPVPPCSACAGMAERVAVPPSQSTAGTAAAALSAMPQEAEEERQGPGARLLRSSSAAALAAAAAMHRTLPAEVAAGEDARVAVRDSGSGGGVCGAAAALRRLELTRLPGITARGVAAAAAGLSCLTELRVASCQAVCREACVWLPHQLGRPSMSVVCSHAQVYEEF